MPFRLPTIWNADSLVQVLTWLTDSISYDNNRYAKRWSFTVSMCVSQTITALESLIFSDYLGIFVSADTYSMNVWIHVNVFTRVHLEIHMPACESTPRSFYEVFQGKLCDFKLEMAAKIIRCICSLQQKNFFPISAAQRNNLDCSMWKE